jgi:hypothetical protein
LKPQAQPQPKRTQCRGIREAGGALFATPRKPHGKESEVTCDFRILDFLNSQIIIDP